MAVRFRNPVGIFSSPPILSRQPHRMLRCSVENKTIQSFDTRKDQLFGYNRSHDNHKKLCQITDLVVLLKPCIFFWENARVQLFEHGSHIHSDNRIGFPFHHDQKWRQDFGVSGLSEECVKSMYATGKAYVHDFLDVNGRPVLVVTAAKHFPTKQDALENQKLCVFLIEKALNKLPPGKEDILGIFDLRGFQTENADVMFLKFLLDVFYSYYPRRLNQVLFVEAPFIFQPLWRLVKPLIKSYASLVRFCDIGTVRTEYFTEATIPEDFKE